MSEYIVIAESKGTNVPGILARSTSLGFAREFAHQQYDETMSDVLVMSLATGTCVLEISTCKQSGCKTVYEPEH